MANSLSNGHKSPRRQGSASCSSYCSLGTRWKESRTGCPAFLSKFIVIVRQTMKMRKSTSKILSLVLVLSFVFSLSAVTASAADTNEQDELVTFILEYDKSCEVYELSDGTTVVFGVIPAASTYAGYDIEKATARPTATHTYTCSANLGDECRGAIENIDEENSMTATMEYDATSAPEDNVSSTRTIVPGDRLVMVAKSTSGNGLAGIMTATITAEKASSVIYSYSVDQHW